MRQSSLVIRNDTPLRLYFLFLCSIQDSFSGLAGFYCTPAYNKMPRDGIEPSFLDFQSNTLTTYVIWADTEISEISLGSRKFLFSLLYLRIILSCPTLICICLICRNRRVRNRTFCLVFWRHDFTQ